MCGNMGGRGSSSGKATGNEKQVNSMMEDEVLKIYTELFSTNSKYGTFITQKQAGVVFRAYKSGDLKISSDDVKTVYNAVSTLGVSPQYSNSPLEERNRLVKVGLEAVFKKKYDVAAYAIKKASKE